MERYRELEPHTDTQLDITARFCLNIFLQADVSLFCPAPLPGSKVSTISGTKHEGKGLLRGKVHKCGLDARLIQLQSPQSAQNMAELVLISSKRHQRHTRGYQFSTHFHGIAVFWSPFISPIKIYYRGCFAFQISVGKTTKVVTIIL